MKQFITIAALCTFLLGFFDVNAQKESKKFSAGFGLEGGLPLADANANYRFTGGITIRFSYHVGPGFITLTSGAVAYVPKSFQGKNVKASLQIPIKAGYKYIFYKPFFVMGEIGYSPFKIYYGDNGNIASTSSGGLTYAPSIGVNLGAFEVGIKYEATAVSGATFANAGLRLAFNF